MSCPSYDCAPTSPVFFFDTSPTLPTPQLLLAENGTSIGAEDGFCGANVRAWCRGINNEEVPRNEPHDFFCNGGDLWIFGFKAEC